MKFDFKSVLLCVFATILIVGLFSIDFLPSNKKEFERICWNMWSTDSKQYDTCMSPYYRQANLDKYAIGFAVVVSIASAVYLSRRNPKS